LSQEKNSQKKKVGMIPGFGARFLRAFGNLKQAEIADLLSVQPSAITNYTKDRVPKPHILLKVWEHTQCDLHWLLTGEHARPVEVSTPPSPPPVPLGNGERQLVEQVAQNDHQSFDQALRMLVIEALSARGMLRKQASPTMLVYRQDITLVAIPLIGSLSAGQLNYFKEQKQVMVADVFLHDGYQSFVLKIVGNDYTDEGYSDGDYLICCENLQPQSSQVVIAVIDDGPKIIKRIFFEGTQVRLQPPNGTGSGDLYPVENVKIVYTVSGVLKNP
jgi:SOS-response transcriptional repressor LexA